MGRTSQEQGLVTSRVDTKNLPKPKPVTRPLMKIAIPAKATPAKGTPSELTEPPVPPALLAEGTDAGIDNRATVEMAPLDLPPCDAELDPPNLDDDELVGAAHWESVEQPDPDRVQEALHMDDLEQEPAEPQEHWEDVESDWGAASLSEQRWSKDDTNPGVESDDELTTADQLAYADLEPTVAEQGSASIHSTPQVATLLFGMQPLVPPRPQAIPLTVPPSADAEQRIATMPISRPWYQALLAAARVYIARIHSWVRRRLSQPKLMDGAKATHVEYTRR
ncbi:MAG: hypothetical protein AB7P03_17620 [Kofleriaceae bacterium]